MLEIASATSTYLELDGHENEFGRARILIVDDNEINRDMLSRRLKKLGHDYLMAENGEQALAMLEQHRFDLVLLDIMMPKMNGYEVLEAIREDRKKRNIPIIVVSALDDMDSVIKCIEYGAEDYLTKPFNAVLLKARINASLEKKYLRDREEERQLLLEKNNIYLSDRVREQTRQISSAQLAAIFAMSKLAESRDPETGEHLERMREYCRTLAESLQKFAKYQSAIDQDFIDTLYAASPLHDIGKVGIPDSVLLKPGKLTTEEWTIMRMHSMVGAETLRAIDKQHPGNSFLQVGIDIAESHHERWDGSGYPHGLVGDDIPLVARILAIGDVYDALTSKRCYKVGFTHEKSKEYILQQRGKHFDPDVIDAFLASEEIFVEIRKEFPDPDISSE